MKKNTIKRALATAAAFLLAVTIGGGTALTVKADDNTATITVHPAASDSSNPTYTAYKIFSATKADPNSSTSQSSQGGAITNITGAVSYTINRNSSWFSVLFSDSNGVPTAKSDQSWVTATRIGEVNTSVYNYTSNIGATTSLTNDTAKAFADYLNTNKPSSISTNDKVYTLSKNDAGNYTANVEPGYYLITSSVGSSVIAATTNVDMFEKNNYPTEVKNQSTDGTTYTHADVSRSINQTVYYHVDVTIPATANKAITITDVMSKGLTLQTTATSPSQVNVTWSGKTTTTTDGTSTDTALTADEISGLNLPTAWTVDASNPASDGSNKYTVEIPAAAVQSLAGKANSTTTVTLTASYQAKLNADAVVANGVNPNKATITYDNYTSQESTVNVKTYDFNLEKTFTGSSDTDTNLQATFQLHKDTENGAVVFFTDNSTATTPSYVVKEGDDTGTRDIVAKKGTTYNIKGLAEGTYYLVETASADGYNKLAKPIKIEVISAGVSFTNQNETNATATTASLTPTLSVANTQGTVLPSTGGIGTTIFYVAGGILIIGAVVLLISRKKASTNN